MDLAHQSKPSLWNALLWKDFQQVKSTFTFVVVFLLGVQIICLIAFLLIQHEETRLNFMGVTVTLPCIAPILLALGCSGMLIGHERQTGTWAWSSSLPVSWTQALASKLFVAVAGSLGVCIPLAIMPLWFLFTQAPRLPETAVAAYVVFVGFLIFAEVVAFCFLFTLMMRDTLMALVVTAVALIFFNIFIPTWIVIQSGGALVRWGVPENVVGETAIAFSVCGLVLTAGFLVAIVFRWRWGIGQRATLAFWQRIRVVSVPSQAHYQFAIGTVPSEWWMLVRQSLTNSFWLRIAIVTGTLLLCMTDIVLEPLFVPLIILPLAVGLIGVTSFEGDRTLARFRFLSDRGVNPWKLVLSRMGVAAIWALAIIAAVLVMSVRWRAFGDRALFAIGTIPIAFLVGAFASMCFRKPFIAVNAAGAVSIGALAITTNLVGLVWMMAGPRVPFKWIVLYFAPVAIIAISVGIFKMITRWLVTDDARLEVHFIWIALAATLSPIFLACTFGFLLIPNVNIQLEETVFSPSRLVAMPDIEALTEVLCSDLKPTDSQDSFGELENLARSRGRGLEGVSRTADFVVAQVSAELTDQRQQRDETLAAVFVPSISKLEECMDKEPLNVEASKVSLPKLETLIARTAALATIATKCEDAESSVRLWKLNRRLQEIAQQCNPLQTHASRNVSMYLLKKTSNGEIAAMGGPEVFRTLIPPIPQERTASLGEIRQALSSYRKAGFATNSSDTTFLEPQFRKYYPPIHWMIERQMSVDLDGQIKNIRQQRENFLTGHARDLLVARVSQE